MSSFMIAVIQLNSSDEIDKNITQIEPLVRDAAAQSAKIVALPENSFYMRREGHATMADVSMTAHPGVIAAQHWAQQFSLWIAIGSIRAWEETQDKPYNRSVLISPAGAIAAHYDKLHLFDVTLPNGHEYRESSQAVGGDVPVLARTPYAALGLTICYDLRFPALYQALAKAGAEVLFVPSAFTRPTGAAHWHSLLRARAIENACYVVAAAQCGVHAGGRETYGHSLIIDPWGEIIAEASADKIEIITAMIDLEKIQAVRAQIPVLQHARTIGPVKIEG